MAKHKQRVGFWRWYLRRLAVGLLFIVLMAGVTVCISALALFGLPAILRWLVYAPLYQQIISVVMPSFTFVTIFAFNEYLKKGDC